MSLILLVLKNLPEIISIWYELVGLISAEREKEDAMARVAKAQALKKEYFDTLKACKTNGNTDALRDFIGRVRAQSA